MQRHWFYRLTDGLFTGDAYAGHDLDANMPHGCGAVSGVVDWQSQRVDISTGELIDWQPPAPADDDQQTWAWHSEARRWVSQPTLAAMQAQAWAAVKAERSRRLAGTFDCAGRTYQIDRDNVPGAALDALRAQLAGEAWSQAWVLADNTVATLNAAEMIAVGRAMRQAISDLWATSEVLRAQIQAAITPEQLASITWP